MPATSNAFLSVRMESAARDRLKAVAAARGESVQAIVGGLVDRFLAEHGQDSLDLGRALQRLRDAESELRARGLAAIAVFGSVARGEARPESDLDLLVEFDPAARVSAVGLASLRAVLTDLLRVPVDLAERSNLRPTVREAAERDAVRAW